MKPQSLDELRAAVKPFVTDAGEKLRDQLRQLRLRMDESIIDVILVVVEFRLVEVLIEAGYHPDKFFEQDG